MYTQTSIAVGRRKTSVARVWLKPGDGEILINQEPLKKYFPIETLQKEILEPLKVTETEGQYNIHVNVRGGGQSGQAGAIKLGIARALTRLKEDFRPILRAYGLLTRDARMVERKKYGLRKARKRFQFSKR